MPDGFKIRCSESEYTQWFPTYDLAERKQRLLVSLGDRLVCRGEHWITPANGQEVMCHDKTIRELEVQDG